MDEKNELNDIILNKTAQNTNTKKILLTIATFAIILIIVITVMNQFSGKKESALPHSPLNNEIIVEEVMEEPQYETTEEHVPVIEDAIEHTSELGEDDDDEETVSAPDGKDETERIVETVFEDSEVIEEPKQNSTKTEPKQAVLKPKKITPSGKYNPKTKKTVHPKTTTTDTATGYYIQVGSFAKYAPAKSFLDKIANRGYTYTFYKKTRNGRTLNKVLVGPFKTSSAAREALPVIKRHIEPGAFLTKK